MLFIAFLDANDWVIGTGVCEWVDNVVMVLVAQRRPKSSKSPLVDEVTLRTYQLQAFARIK